MSAGAGSARFERAAGLPRGVVVELLGFVLLLVVAVVWIVSGRVALGLAPDAPLFSRDHVDQMPGLSEEGTAYALRYAAYRTGVHPWGSRRVTRGEARVNELLRDAGVPTPEDVVPPSIRLPKAMER